jgi:acylglycerol lipase
MIQENWFDANPQVKLYERRLMTETPPLANIVIIHGFGDHCSRYEWVMNTFRNAGMASYTYDQRGHGHSPGKRAYIQRFEDLLDDLDVFLKHIASDLSPAPLFLMGHSMGGMVLARYAQTRNISAKGLIFSSPFLAFSDEVPEFLIALGPIIAKVLPWLPIGKVDNSGLSRDPAIIEMADNDPLCHHGRVAAHTAGEFSRMIKAIGENGCRVETPMLVIHGNADRVVSPSGSRAFHDKAEARDKTFHLYPDGYHELYNDLDKEEFMEEIITWIKARP